MQQSMPQHLRKYVDGSNSTYVPQHVEKQISQYMEKSMPAHMKQYAGAYMEQRVIRPNTANPHTAALRPQGPRQSSVAPMPDKLKLGHSMSSAQYNVGWAENPGQQPAPLTPAAQSYQEPQQVPAQPQGTPNQPPYDFIMNPGAPQPPKRGPIPGGGSFAMRALYAAGALLLLFVLFVILKGVFFGNSTNAQSFLTIAQDQQALIHLANGTSEQTELSTVNTNFVATAQLSLKSSQSELIEYMATNGSKVDTNKLNAKISAAKDERLQTAAAATTYNETFKEIMDAELTNYISDLQKTYDQTEGEKGRELLSATYDQAVLLQTQLNSTSD